MKTNKVNKNYTYVEIKYEDELNITNVKTFPTIEEAKLYMIKRYLKLKKSNANILSNILNNTNFNIVGDYNYIGKIVRM